MEKIQYSLLKPKGTLAVTSSLHPTFSTAFHSSPTSWYNSKQRHLSRAPLHPMGVRCSRVRQNGATANLARLYKNNLQGCSKKLLLVPEWPCFMLPFHTVGTHGCEMALPSCSRPWNSTHWNYNSSREEKQNCNQNGIVSESSISLSLLSRNKCYPSLVARSLLLAYSSIYSP